MEPVGLFTDQKLKKFIDDVILRIDIDEDGFHSELLKDLEEFKVKVEEFLINFEKAHVKYYILYNLLDFYLEVYTDRKKRAVEDEKLIKENDHMSKFDVSFLYGLKEIEEIIEWLQLHLDEYNSSVSKQKPSITEKATHKQQMLILHYLGVLEKISLITQKRIDQAKLISYLINRNEKNTKTFIESMKLKMLDIEKDVAMTPKNLRFVHTLFTDLGLSDLADKVQIDLDLALREK